MAHRASDIDDRLRLVFRLDGGQYSDNDGLDMVDGRRTVARAGRMDDLGFVVLQAVSLKRCQRAEMHQTPNKGKGRNIRRRDPLLLREELLRPSSFLGYNRDRLGVYFMEREAFELAESQFRRAAWLNPFEAWFKMHWATALLALNRPGDAKLLLSELMTDGPCAQVAQRLWRKHWPAEPLPDGAAPRTDASQA
ncbi:MAG: hypothetical protein HZB38_05105 [Planctomycetes bacterium]|nr:hypothetical protein [Planctomycetota bacterium]